MSIILEALLNTLWQTGAIALLAWVGLRWTPRINAATRAAVWWAVLAFVILLPFIRGLREMPGGSPAPRPALSMPVSEFAAPDSVPAPVALPLPRQETAQVMLPSGSWTTLFLAVWFAFFAGQCARLACSYVHLRRLKERGQPPSREQKANFDAWMMTCSIRRPTRLLISRAVPMPVAVGFHHPAVVLPEGLLGGLTATELDHVLLHELAHIARRDDWTNLLARIASAVLALHPVAAWVLRQIDRERELACDDWVVAATGAARPYAASLARLFELCSSRRSALLASGIADSGSQLGNRIAMLLRRGREFSPRASALRVSACAAVMLVLMIAASRTPAWIAFAQTKSPVSRAQAKAIEESPQGAVPASNAAPQAPAAPSRAAQAVVPAAPASAALPAASPHSLLAALAANGYGDLSVDEIIELKVQGVSPDFISGMAHSGMGKLPARQLIDLKVQGVNPGYVTEILALSFGPYTPNQIIEFKVQGVSTDLFRALKESGFVHADAREIIEAKIHGVGAGHLREARKYGPNLTLQQIIRMKQAGVL
jgi:beta-lactamase regulating signal transducer with metallopeptidase domain